MKGRKGLIAVAVLCVLAQLGLGASSALGLVLCVGADHTAVEMPSDDCCANHEGTAGRTTAIETSCCDDLPLVSTWRSVTELRRTDVGASSAGTATAVVPSPSIARLVFRTEGAATWSPPPLVLRPAILRV